MIDTMMELAAGRHVSDDALCNTTVSQLFDQLQGEWIVDTDPLHRSLLWWAHYCGDLSLPDALRWFAARVNNAGGPDVSEDQTREDRVTLSTVHAAKGLEWPVVILAEMAEGTFPSSASRRDPDCIIQERRLAYVGVTRARERLFVHVIDDGRRKPSRFVDEMFGGTTNGKKEEVRQELPL